MNESVSQQEEPLFTTHFGIRAVVEPVPAHVAAMFGGSWWPEQAARPLIFIPGSNGTRLIMIPAEEV